MGELRVAVVAWPSQGNLGQRGWKAVQGEVECGSEIEVSVGTVKMRGRSFGWRRRVGERDAEVARAIAGKSLKDGTERTARNRKIVEMGLVKVAKAIAEGKEKPTISGLDRLVRLEEFLKAEHKGEGTKITLEWADSGKKGDEEDYVEVDRPDGPEDIAR